MLKEAGITVVAYEEDPEWRKEVISLFSEEIPERENEGQVRLKNSQ